MGNFQNVFYSGCITLHFYHKHLRVPVSLQPYHYLQFSFFDNRHHNGCEVVLHYSFDLYFLNDYWCLTSFHVLNKPSYIFFGEMTVEILCLVFSWSFLLLLVSCRNSLYFLDISFLSGIYDLQTFYPILWVIFSLSWYYPLLHNSC